MTSMVGKRFASSKEAKKKNLEKKTKPRPKSGVILRKLEPGQLPYTDNGLGVWLDSNVTPEQAMKRLKRKVVAEGLPQKIRNSQRHTRPAEARRKAKELAIRKKDKRRLREKLKSVYERMRERPVEDIVMEAMKVAESIS